jgi:hypothetical protein
LRSSQLQHPTRPSQIRSTYFKQWMDAIWETMYCRVTYTYEASGLTHLAQGWMRDFSHTDCAIRGSLLPPIGSATTVTLHLRDGDPPVSCDGSVSWTAPECFGVSIRPVHDKDCTRIQQYLLDLHYVTMTVW